MYRSSNPGHRQVLALGFMPLAFLPLDTTFQLRNLDVPNISTIVVPDAAATPVNHTFNKLKVTGDTALFIEQSASAAVGYWPLNITCRAPLANQQNKVYRVTIALAMPVITTEVINGVNRPKLEYTCRRTVEYVFPEGSTLQNRKDVRKMGTLIEADSNVVTVIESLLNVT